MKTWWHEAMAQVPSLLGIQPDALRRRGAFTFAQSVPSQSGARDPWSLLEHSDQDMELIHTNSLRT